MRIARVQTHLLEHKLDVAFESAGNRFDKRQHLLVEITCDDGTTGWGECLGPAPANAAIVQMMAGRMIGANPLETEKIWLDLYHWSRDQGQRGVTITALSGIDIALWDIKGKALGQPISVLMGGRFRESVRAYATGAFRTDGVDRVPALAAECAGYRDEGFHATKIKIGFGVEEDIRAIAAVREAIGPEMRLMIDANHGYDVIEAVKLGKAAAHFDIDWFEEPVLPEMLEAYGEVKARQPIPVAGGETWHARWGFKSPVERRAVDILQPDICGCGGFTEGKRISDMAALHGLRLVPHVWGTAVQIAASLQFIASLPPNPPRPEPIEPILEFDRTENPFRQAVVTLPLEQVKGVVAIPDGPGLGIEINRDALAEFAPR